MKKMYLVWNQSKTEFFGTDDPLDAKYVSTGREQFGSCGVSSVGEYFRETYAEEGDEVLEITTIEFNI